MDAERACSPVECWCLRVFVCLGFMPASLGCLRICDACAFAMRTSLRVKRVVSSVDASDACVFAPLYLCHSKVGFAWNEKPAIYIVCLERCRLEKPVTLLQHACC